MWTTKWGPFAAMRHGGERVGTSLARELEFTWLRWSKMGVQNETLAHGAEGSNLRSAGLILTDAPNGHGSKPMIPFWDRCTTHFRTQLRGDWVPFTKSYDLGSNDPCNPTPKIGSKVKMVNSPTPK